MKPWTRSPSGRFSLRALARPAAASEQFSLARSLAPTASFTARLEVSRSRRSSLEMSCEQPAAAAINNHPLRQRIGTRASLFGWNFCSLVLGHRGYPFREDSDFGLRRAVHPADRAARARAGRVLRDPPAGLFRGGAEGLRPQGNHPLRRAGLGGGGRLAALRSERVRAGSPGPGDLL